MTERRRRLLLVSGLALVTSSVGGFALATTSSSAATPPPTVVPPTTLAPPTTLPATTSLLPTEPTTPAEPTTTVAPETTAPAPVLPSVAFAANAQCDPAAGQTTVVWELTNNGAAPVQITDLTEPVTLEPNPVPPGATATATRVIDGPATDVDVTSTVTIDASGVVLPLSDGITAPHCEGPALPPDLTFDFGVSPSVSEAAVGDTVEYEYCGTNTSTIPLEIVEFSDDRLGVAFEGSVVVAPGETICNTDVGRNVDYVVQPSDAGSVIDHNAVVTMRTQEDQPREFQATTQASVTVSPHTVDVAPLLVAGGGFTIQKTVSPTSVVANSDITYEIVIGFSGQTSGVPFTVTDAVPAVLTSVIGSCGAVSQATCAATGSGNSRSWTITPSAAGGLVRLSIAAHVPQIAVGTVVTNTAIINNGALVASNTFTIIDVIPPTPKAVPKTPLITPGYCDTTTNTPVAPKLQTLPTEGITYQVIPPTPPTPAGGSFTVMATTQSGYEMAPQAELPPNWVWLSATQAYIVIVFDPVACPATPVNPTVVQAKCVGGVTTPASVTLPPNGGGITYSMTPSSPVAGDTVVVTATLSANHVWVSPLPAGWSPGNPAATKATYSVTLNAATCQTATPGKVTVSESLCVGGVVTEAGVFPPADGGGIDYTMVPAVPVAGELVTVTAVLADGYAWVDPLPDGWDPGVPAETTAVFTVQLDPAATCRSVLPENPLVGEAECIGGVVTAPKIFPADTTGVTYTVAPGEPYAPGDTVVVTATVKPGFTFGSPLPTGWSAGVPATAKATRSVTFAAATCQTATPAPVTVQQSSCVNGVVTEAKVTPPANGGGITYTMVPAVPKPGDAVTVTAVLADGYKWVSPLPNGWAAGVPPATTSVFRVTLNAAATCTTATPVNPTVVQAKCVGGVTTPASVTLPPNGGGITYSMTPSSPVAGDTVVVTATLTGQGVGWPATMPTDWTRTGPTTATYKPIVLQGGGSCFPVLPVDPVAKQATCTAGVVTVPTIALASTPAGVTYVAVPAGPYDGTVTTPVTVTATLSDGLAWGTMPATWTYVDPVTATYKVTLNAASCSVVAPVAPTVTQAVCRGGVFVPPTVTLATTTGITYTKDKTDPYFPLPMTVTVTATLTGEGVGWPATLPDKWTRTGATTATYPVLLQAASCTPVVPVDPVATQATCTAGVVTVPTIALASTPAGVTYVAVPAGPYDGTVTTPVTVTATLSDGLAWGTMPATWTYVDPVTATYKVTLNAASCSVVAPVAPTVTQAVCRGGVFVPPTVTLATTTGITYTKDKTDPYFPLPMTVTVTATLTGEGVGWPATLPDKWTRTGATTATYPVLLQAASCTPVVPVDPVATQATCTAGVVTVPTIALASTPAGVTYVAVPAGPYDGTVTTPVTVTATLSDGLAWGTMPATWTYVNATTATFAMTLKAASCSVVAPVDPTVTQAICRNGVLEPATVTTPTTTGITYTVNPEGPYVQLPQLVTVTATLDDAGVGWPDDLPADWVEGNATTATYTALLRNVSCTPVVPVDPVATQATCANGVVTVPTIALASTPAGVTYVAVPTGPYDGTVATPVTVTATLSDGLAWGTLPATWTYVNATTATFAMTLKAASCSVVAPVDPTVTQAVCRGGVLEPATVTTPTTTGITYTVNPEGPYVQLPQLVSVTATLDDAGVGWPDELPADWVEGNATTATYTALLRNVKCTPVVPVDPVATQATCANGVVTVPTIALASTPAGVTYVAVPTGPYDGTVATPVTVTATLSDGVAWGTLPATWTYVSPTTATYLVTLNAASCTEVTPVDPTVTQAVCRGGVVEPPTLELPTTDGITYTADPEGPYEAGDGVTVTATLDDAGVGWPDNLAALGWTEVDSTTATYQVTFADVACTPVQPVDPTVTQATCTAGVVTVPTVALASTPAGVTYVADPAGPYDGTVTTPVTVTATLSDGLAWGELPDDWTEESPTEATFTVELVGTTCDEVTPVAPTNHDAECVNGALTPPTLTLAETDEISYSADEDPPYAPGQTIEVTATLEDDGVAWPDQLPEGWTETSDTTATYTHTFDDVTCTPVLPVDPAVVEGTCANGVLTASSVQFEATPGLVYSVDPPGPYDPAAETDVVVTATVLDGYAWEGSEAAPAGFAGRGAIDVAPLGAPPPVDLPAGWTWLSPTAGTFTITLPQAPPCPEAAPTTTAAAAGEAPTTSAATTTDPTTTAAEAGEESATSTAPATGPTTTVPGPIPDTGASGLPGQLLVGLLAVSSGFALIMVGRRRQGLR